MSFIKRVENQNDIRVKQLRTDNCTEFRNSILVNFCDEKGISQNFSSPYTPKQNGVAERKNRTLIEAARTMLSGSVFSKQYWTEAIATACYTQNRSTIVKRHLKTPYEIFRGRIPNIDLLHVFGCLVYIHNHKDYLGKFDEKANDGYFFGYSLVSKAFRVFNTRRQQTKETYHITFDESTDAIKFTKPSDDNVTIVESDRYPPDEYLHPSQDDEIFNEDHFEHSNHNNDNHIIDNLPSTKDVQTSKPIKQSERGISINQEKYVKDLLKKYDINSSSVKAPMVPSNNLGPDLNGKAVNKTHYRGMIGSLMYLIASRPDIQFSTCLCVRYQANPKESHLIVVKRIFRYLKGTPSLGLWYPKCLGFDLKGYSDSDYARCNMDKKSTSSACQLLGGKIMCWSAKKQQFVAMSLAKAEYVAVVGCCVNILWMKS
ncbi:retrovirus-related pol polyprotein from transposon TNT 1-94 [Tanacetum coccineum]